jgi:hypothetical protein
VNRTLLAVGVVAMVGLAGCAGLTGDGADDGVQPETNGTDATGVTYAVGIEVDETTAGSEWTEIGATYPREEFVVDAAGHENITLGVDTDGDEESERSFDETHVSGVNNNAYSFDVTLDTDYTLESGDVVMVEYPDVTNPGEPDEYTVEVGLNGEQTANSTVVIG